MPGYVEPGVRYCPPDCHHRYFPAEPISEERVAFGDFGTQHHARGDRRVPGDSINEALELGRTEVFDG